METSDIKHQRDLFLHWELKDFAPYSANKQDVFTKQYILSLFHCFEAYTADYDYVMHDLHTYQDVMKLANRMIEGLLTGRASKDGQAIKHTCKMLGIKHTYKAIQEYLKS